MKKMTFKRRSSAISMTEFAIVFPFFMVFIMFMIDLGILSFTRTAVQDTLYVAARSSAQYGGAGLDTIGTPDPVCMKNEICDNLSAKSYQVLSNNLQAGRFNFIPSAGQGSLSKDILLTIENGAVCRDAALDRATEVTLQMSYNVRLLLPFLTKPLMGADPTSAAPFSDTATTRCEVVYRS